MVPRSRPQPSARGVYLGRCRDVGSRSRRELPTCAIGACRVDDREQGFVELQPVTGKAIRIAGDFRNALQTLAETGEPPAQAMAMFEGVVARRFVPDTERPSSPRRARVALNAARLDVRQRLFSPPTCRGTPLATAPWTSRRSTWGLQVCIEPRRRCVRLGHAVPERAQVDPQRSAGRAATRLKCSPISSRKCAGTIRIR